MEIYHTTKVSQEEWDSLIRSSDDVWLWHSWKWIEDLARLYSLENHYFLARANGRDVAALPLQLQRLHKYGRSCNQAYSLRRGSAGPFCTREVHLKARHNILSELTKVAVDWAKEMSVQSMSCSLPPLAPNNLRIAHGVNPLVTAGWSDLSGHTRITNLLTSEADLWLGLTHDARRSVKLARSAGYTVERGSWIEMLDDCYRVYVETIKRAGGIPDPKAYMEIFAGMETEGNTVLWVGRDPSGQAVAYHGDARFQGGCWYGTGCCETAHLRSGVNYLLFWESLICAKKDGCAWYEIGEAYPEIKDGKFRGLEVFKGKFGGELYRLYRGEIRLFDWPPQYVRMLILLFAGILPTSVRHWLGYWLEH